MSVHTKTNPLTFNKYGLPLGLLLLEQHPSVKNSYRGSYIVAPSCQVSGGYPRWNAGAALFRTGDQKEKGKEALLP